MVGGQRAARILPELLRPRDWKKMPREDRQRIVRESGIGSFTDFSQILNEAPHPLLETLRLTAIVRNTATLLGATIADRLRINALHAWRGMGIVHMASMDSSAAAAAAAQVTYVGAFASRWARWHLAARVTLLRITFSIVAAVHALLRQPLVA